MTSPNRLALSAPLEPPEIPVIEMATRTRRDEARSVMALVGSFLDQGVPERDIAVVVRNLETYEQPLFRAALQHGITPVFWTQLRVTETRPFALIDSICDALSGETIDKRILLTPLEHRWTPTDCSEPDWPIDSKTIQEAKSTLSEESHTINKWVKRTTESDDVDVRIERFVHWLANVPEPRPDTVASVFHDVVDAYRRAGLPETKATDSPALLDTEIDARAVYRVKTLVEQLRHKFADRLDEDMVDKSWSDVAELATVVATQRPGRREHSHARAIDVLEANDVWVLDVSYVIVAGLTASEWPQETDSVTQPEFEEAILRGQGKTSKLAPDTSWTNGRDRDHFADVLNAAANGLILTRYRETNRGDVVHPSPLFEVCDTDPIGDDEIQSLRTPEREVPASVRSMLPANLETDD